MSLYLFKIPKNGAKPKMYPKMTLNVTNQSSLYILDPKIYLFKLSYCKLHIYSYMQ